MTTLHIVCGLPASGKTTFARELAGMTRSALFDSDTATDLIIQAAHRAAGIDPHDRDSPTYKQTYRDPVYETLFTLASENLPNTDVIIAGPFTAELKDKESWFQNLKQRFAGHTIQLHHLELPEQERHERMKARGALRDQTKT
ncbi:MAG: putative kinase [Cryomorphaceae bacterium]|jgi:predicted kinase